MEYFKEALAYQISAYRLAVEHTSSAAARARGRLRFDLVENCFQGLNTARKRVTIIVDCPAQQSRERVCKGLCCWPAIQDAGTKTETS
jgi:hypothetical protein